MTIIVIYLLTVKKLLNFKAKKSELIIKYPMCLGDLSKDYNRNSCKDTGLHGNVYDLVLTIVLFQMIKYMIFMLI